MKADATLEHRVCPGCGGHAGLNCGRKNHFELLSCSTCATLYTAADSTDGETDYDSYYTAENLAIPEFIHRRLDEIVKTFGPYRKSNRLLDVGCGAGSFLQAAARSNWQAFGVEISRTAAAHVCGQGFEVFCGELEAANYPDGYFDVVVASELLEHLVDPRGLLSEIARILRPGGLLWATTPHGRGISARLLDLSWTVVAPPEHLQLFSVFSIKALLHDIGFQRVKVSTRGTNPFEILRAMRERFTPGRKSTLGAEPEKFDRVQSAYQLNEFMSNNAFRRLLKSALNGLLNTMRLGDSLTIHAEK